MNGTNGIKDMVTFEVLLKESHKLSADKHLGLSITTEMLSVDWDKKQALFKATAKMGEQVFTGYGDATAGDLGSMVAKSWIRMGETRAIVRALKLLTNNATCSEEEK